MNAAIAISSEATKHATTSAAAAAPTADHERKQHAHREGARPSKPAVDDVARRISAMRGRRRTSAARSSPRTPTRSRTTATAAIVRSTSAAIPTDAADKVDPLARRGRRCEGRQPRPLRSVSSARRAPRRTSTDSVGQDLERAGLLSIPVTLVDPRSSPSALSSQPASRCSWPSRLFADDGPARRAEPHLAGRRERQRRRAADRARRRRRLFALLLEARARGACRGDAARAPRSQAAAATSGRPCSSPASPS